MITPGQQKIILGMWKATKPTILKIQKQNPNDPLKVVEAFDRRIFYGPIVPPFTVSEIKKKFKVYPGKTRPDLNKEAPRALKNLEDHGFVNSSQILEWKGKEGRVAAKGFYKNLKRSDKKKLKEHYMKKGNQTEYSLTFQGSILGECLIRGGRKES